MPRKAETDKLYSVFLSFDDTVDTNWLVRAPNKRAAADAVKSAAMRDGALAAEIDTVETMGRPSVRRIDEEKQRAEFAEYFDVDLRSVRNTPIMYDMGT